MNKVGGMKKPKNNLSDRERILIFLLNEARSCEVLGGIQDTGSVRKPQWRYAKRGEPVAGQLVIANTSGYHPHPHVVAWCVGRGDPGPKYSERDVPKIRAIGEAEWIWFFNESFSIYNGHLDNTVFLEGWKREYYGKVLRAMKLAGDTWRYRFSRLNINDGTAILTVRPHIFFAKSVHGDKGDEPFEIQLPATEKTLQRELVSAMKAGGFGTRWEKKAT